MRTLYLNLIAFTFISILFVNQSFGQAVLINSVTINNPPATSCTNTYIKVDGILSSSFTFTDTVITISGNNITVDVIYSAGLTLPVITPFTHIVDLGKLPLGSYNITTRGIYNATVQSTLTSGIIVNSCCSFFTDFEIDSSPTCTGDTVHFDNTSTGPGTLSGTWYINAKQLNHAFNFDTVFTKTETKIISLVLSDGTCKDSISKVLEVNESPFIDLGEDTSLCFGDSLWLNAGIAGGTYIWHDASNSPAFLVNDEGLYWVNVTAPGGCDVTDSIYIDTLICPTGFAELSVKEDLFIYPNPSQGQVSVRLPKTFPVSPVDLKVTDLSGKLVYSATLNTNKNEFSIDLSGLNEGLYIIHINQLMNKLSIQR